jgi:CMP/dCMP kinase
VRSKISFDNAFTAMADKYIVIAIDGPAGAGKSTIAKRIAEKLGFVYINTGAMYRAVALWALRLGTELSDMHRLEQLAKEAKIQLPSGGSNVMLNGEDVTEDIRSAIVTEAASKVSAVPAVRRALLTLQRKMAESNSVVMEGRDIGSVVFPGAQVKIFLDADPSERARRRTRELQQGGTVTDENSVQTEMKARDERDRNRAEAPLVQAPDAQLIETTGLTLEEVEEAVLRVVRAKTSNGKAASSL